MKKRSILSIIVVWLVLGCLLMKWYNNTYAIENITQKIKMVLPKNFTWEISQSKIVRFDPQNQFLIVGAFFTDLSKGSMGGKIFVYKEEHNETLKQIWSSSEFEAASILSIDFHTIPSTDKILVAGTFLSGGSRGTMNDVEIFTISKHGEVNVIKQISIGIGNITQSDQIIEIEGELLQNVKVISFQNGVYTEENKTTIYDISNWSHPVKKVFEKYHIRVERVELLQNNTYPIFYVGFPNDLIKGSKSDFVLLIQEIASANAYWDYKIIDVKNVIFINVQCIKREKKIKMAEFYQNDTMIYKL